MKAAINKYGLIEINHDTSPKKPIDVPKITNIAGPIQHDAISIDVIIDPILEMFVLSKNIISFTKP
jgi:hypothetical protein